MADQHERVFGPAIGGWMVDDAIVSILDMWLPDYLHEVARRANPFEPDFKELPPVRSKRIATSMHAFPEDQQPAIIIVNNGCDELPQMATADPQMGKARSAVWEYDIGIHIRAKGTRVGASPRGIRKAWMYALAVRMCLTQQRDLEGNGIIAWADWKNERPVDLDGEVERTTALVVTTFNVTVPNVVAWGTGPLTPGWPPTEGDPPQQSPEWPTALHAVDLDIIKEPGAE
jgi:hypothetical protein